MFCKKILILKHSTHIKKTMNAFVVSHTPMQNKRLVFIDELYVQPSHRRKRYGIRMLRELVSRPLALIVRPEKNKSAYALYNKIEMCPACPLNEHYIPKQNEITMRTSSFLKTKRAVDNILTRAPSFDETAVKIEQYQDWASIDKATQSQMIRALVTAHKYSVRHATQNLTGQSGDRMRYHILRSRAHI